MPSKSDLTFSRVLVESGLLTGEQADACLAIIRKSEEDGRPKSLGEAVIQQGILQERPLRNAFSLMTRFPFEQRKRGDVIGKYRVVRQVGHGGMGPCYEVVHTQLPQESGVLKILPAVMASILDFRERFFIQVIKAMRLRHENVVRTIEADIDGKFRYVVQELVPGQPLGTVLDHLPMLDEIQAREIVVQVSLALRHLQKFGLVHGNLKPNNILLTHTGLVKLADCALAPFSGWGEVVIQSSRQWGAPYYCSPEHGRAGRHLDFRSDIYCLGVVLYEMLTGGVPFSGGIPILDLRRRMTETWPDPRSKNPRISDQGMAILQKMTVLSIDERYSSYDELLRDLESFPGFKRGPQPARKAEMDEEGKPEEWADTRLVETVEAQGSGRASRAEAVEPEDPHTGDFYRAAKAAESPEQTAEEEQGNKSFLDGSRELIALLEDAEKAQHKNPTPTKNLRVQEPDEDGSVGEEKPEPEAKKPAEEPERAEPPAPAPAEAAPAPPPVGASYRMAPLVIGLVSATLTALIALLVLYLSGAFG